MCQVPFRGTGKKGCLGHKVFRDQWFAHQQGLQANAFVLLKKIHIQLLRLEMYLIVNKLNNYHCITSNFRHCSMTIVRRFRMLILTIWKWIPCGDRCMPCNRSLGNCLRFNHNFGFPSSHLVVYYRKYHTNGPSAWN